MNRRFDRPEHPAYMSEWALTERAITDATRPYPMAAPLIALHAMRVRVR